MKLLYLALFFYSVSVYAQDSFFDKYGRLHDVKVEAAGEPSSDNGWLYSAIYKKLGGKLKIQEQAAKKCVKHLKRHPEPIKGREDIPISRDEILGLAYLGYLKKQDLDGWHFSPVKLEPFNLWKFVNQSLELVESWYPFQLKHRTYFWKNNLTQIGHLAYMVPVQDRHFLLQQWGEYNFFYHIVHEIDVRIYSKDRSSRQIKFLKTGQDPEAILNYYQNQNHPSVTLLNSL